MRPMILFKVSFDPGSSLLIPCWSCFHLASLRDLKFVHSYIMSSLKRIDVNIVEELCSNWFKTDLPHRSHEKILAGHVEPLSLVFGMDMSALCFSWTLSVSQLFNCQAMIEIMAAEFLTNKINCKGSIMMNMQIKFIFASKSCIIVINLLLNSLMV